MITWPNDLVCDIARRKSVLYLGSGVSANSVNAVGKHPPTWEAFLRGILDKRKDVLVSQLDIITKLLNESDYLSACEIIVDVLGEPDFGELSADEFRRPGYQPTEIHNVIYGLDSRIVITPNVDKIYEQCALSNSHSTVVVKKYYEDIAPFLRNSDYIIIKAHGCVDNPEKLVFTHKQYNTARYNHSAFYRILDALLLTHTFVFLGCGISDPDIQLTLENCNFSFPNCRPHYFVTASGTIHDAIVKNLFTNRNIKVLTYDNADGTHKELLSDLKELEKLVDKQREEYSLSATW